MQMHYEPDISPLEFEIAVKGFLESVSTELVAFAAVHREKIDGVDGTYEIDVSVRFRALGVEFLVLVECKHHRTPIKRDQVQILRDRMLSMGAQKGMIFATSMFQRGAIEYARSHSIALITVRPSEVEYHTHGPKVFIKSTPWSRRPGEPGWVICPGVERLNKATSTLSHKDLFELFLVCSDRK